MIETRRSRAPFGGIRSVEASGRYKTETMEIERTQLGVSGL